MHKHSDTTSGTRIRVGLIAGAVALPLVAGAAVAQERFLQHQDAGTVRGDWIVGATVHSEAGADVGSIDDLLIDPDGTVAAAVIEVGGFLGIGGKLVAVDWDALEVEQDGRRVTIALTEEQAETAPEFVYRDRSALPAASGDGDPMPVDGGTAGSAGAGAAPDAPEAEAGAEAEGSGGVSLDGGGVSPGADGEGSVDVEGGLSGGDGGSDGTQNQ